MELFGAFGGAENKCWRSSITGTLEGNINHMAHDDQLNQHDQQSINQAINQGWTEINIRCARCCSESHLQGRSSHLAGTCDSTMLHYTQVFPHYTITTEPSRIAHRTMAGSSSGLGNFGDDIAWHPFGDRTELRMIGGHGSTIPNGDWHLYREDDPKAHTLGSTYRALRFDLICRS